MTLISIEHSHIIKSQNNLKLQQISIMYSSKIEQLSQSTFRQEKIPKSKQLLQFQLKMSPCPFHHQPTDCQCSTYGVCSLEQCRNLHSDPDADFIQLTVFNELVRENCSSLLVLSQKMSKYFKEIRENLIHKVDISIERSLYLIRKVYLQEVPNLIRMKQYSKLSPQKLSHFVKFELNEGSKVRAKMQALKNTISSRITNRQNLLQRLCLTKDFESILLSDVVKLEQSSSNQILSKVQLTMFDSAILVNREYMQIINKFLRQNRATMYSNVSLIFRGSQHQFKPQALHKSVDGKSPLLFIVKTTLGKVFGAYLNCKINDRQDWIADATGLSFIFSIDNQQSFRLKGDAKSRLKAVYGGSKGVQIGSGCDLYLSQDCHLNRKSGSNLGGSYRLPGFLQFNTPKSRGYLASEQLFQVEQYEFFQFE